MHRREDDREGIGPRGPGPASPTRTVLRGLLVAASVGLIGALLPARPIDAQEATRGCGAQDARLPFPAPAASPLEPHTRLAAVRVHRGERDRWVALADLGERVPFWLSRGCPPDEAEAGTSAAGRRAPGDPGEPPGLQLAGAVAGGAFSRFDLEGRGNELLEAHYRVGLRLRARWRGVAGRLEAYHVSSHLGDEFLERTGRSPISTSREGLELLLQARPGPRFRLYGGPGVVVRSTEDLDPLSLRAGADWRGGVPEGGGPVPYASVEAFSWEELGWDPTLAGEAGVALGGGRFRLAAVAGAGPSRAEQFFREASEALWGLSFSVTW